jgi:malonyl-CoA O-methyltransferase
MFGKTIDNRIRRAFSNAAISYDVLTGMHKEIARELVDQIKDRAPLSAILDVGIGTGYLTNRLSQYFQGAKVVGIDISDGMLMEAKKKYEVFNVVGSDARALSFKDAQFDLIASNLAYQWIDPLAKSFEECARVLKPNGEIHLTLFGKNTFHELFTCLEAASNVFEKSFIIRRLPSEKYIKEALTNSGFVDGVLREEKISSHFPDMMSLLQWTKDIGANCLSRDSFVGPDLLEKANAFYENNFKDMAGIKVTFQVFWVSAKKHG